MLVNTRMTQRRDATSSNKHIFNVGGANPGVWCGTGVTKTKPSPTLFVMVPDAVSTEEVGELFRACTGFLGWRAVRRMVFVDFNSVQGSTSAMRRFQGYNEFVGTKKQQARLAIDFDKDSRDKRNREYEKEREAKLRDAREMDLVPYNCSICGTTVFKLRNQATLEAQPRRKTDSSIALDTTHVLVDLRVTSGGVKLLRRDKGTERQHRINCCNCGVPLGYKSSPLDIPSRWVYIFSGAVVRKNKHMHVPSSTAHTQNSIQSDCSVRSTDPAPTIKHLTAAEIKRRFTEKALLDKARLEASDADKEMKK